MGASASVPLGTLAEDLTTAEIPEDSPKWDEFYKATAPTADALFEALPATTVRNIRNKNATNFTRLIKKLVDRLRRALTTVEDIDNRTQNNTEIINAVRLLYRFIPVAFEDQGKFCEDLFWQSAPLAPGGPQRVPLAITLLDTVMALLFLPGFTLNEFAAAPPSLAQLRQRRNAVLPLANIWEAGVGTTDTFPSDATHVTARIEVLKLLLCCLSSSMYHRPSSQQRAADSWLHYVCTRPTYYTSGFFLSLLNVACTYDPVGWGVPYNYVFFGDPREELTYLALQLLSVLLEYQPASSPNSESSPKNVFQRYLAAIPPSSFAFVYDGLAKLLSNPRDAAQTYLPSSTKELLCQQETLCVLWRVLLGHPALTQWVLTEADATRVVEPLLLAMLQSRKDEASLGLVHLGVFVLLLLSGERAFGVALNSAHFSNTEALGRTDGSLADLLVLTFAKLLVDSHVRLATLHECMLTIIANIAPYIKSLNVAASVKLLQLFDMFSKRKYLFAGERNHRYVFFLLEAINSLVQYQYEGNVQVVYAILRYKKAFARLANMTLVPPGDDESEVEASLGGPVQQQRGSDKDGFVGTQAWFDEWKTKMPLGTVLRVIDHLSPTVKDLLTGTAEDDAKIVEYLTKTTLVGTLPVPHPILIRKYQQNSATASWFRNYLWGVVFTRNTQPPLFYGTQIKLFTVAIQ